MVMRPGYTLTKWTAPPKRLNCNCSPAWTARRVSSPCGAAASSAAKCRRSSMSSLATGGPCSAVPCRRLRSEGVGRKPLAAYLEQVWDKEHGPRHYPVEYFEHLADGMGVRDALNRLDSQLLGPRPA